MSDRLKADDVEWAYAHFEDAHAVFLGEESMEPVAVFGSADDADAWIGVLRQREQKDDIEHWDAAAYGPYDATRGLDSYLPSANVLRVKNCYVPWLNDGLADPDTVADPPPVPDYVGTVAPMEPQPLADLLGRITLLLACLRNHRRSKSDHDLAAAYSLGDEVYASMGPLNPLFREG